MINDTIKMKFHAHKEKLNSQKKIEYVEDTTSVVIAKGVQSVLDSITPESLSAYVDLSGYGPGTYSVPVEVTGENLNASYLPKSKNIQIKIANKS